MVSSVKIPEGSSHHLLFAVLGRDLVFGLLPPHFETAMNATAGVHFLFDSAANYLSEINAWQLASSTKTVSKHTRAARSSALKAILNWYEANDLRWQDCTELAHINLMRLYFRGISPGRTSPLVAKRTWNQWMIHWYAFLRYAEDVGWISGISFDLRDVKQSGVAETSIGALRPEEFRRFSESISTQRMRAGSSSCIGTGIRLAELAGLPLADVPLPMEFGDRSYLPRTIVGKGQKRREIYWPLAASKAVYAYRMGERALALDNLIARVCSGALALKDTFLEKAINQATGETTLIEGPNAPLWLAENGDPLSYSRWPKEFAKVSRLSGVYASAHWMRHSYAVITLSMLIKQQVKQSIIESKLGINDSHVYFRDPVDEVRRRLGHSSIKTTLIYLDHIAEHRHLVELALMDLERMYLAS